MEQQMTPNEVTGANAGGARRLQIRALRAARVAQFTYIGSLGRSTLHDAEIQ